jgi:uncharacterized membrane protein YdjX (TVP38/TMEM64 family)
LAESRKRRWLLLGLIILAFILIPFVLFADTIEMWTQDFLESAGERSALVAAVLGTLLAIDILLPVPSSVVSTAAGLFLGFTGGMMTSLVGMTFSCSAGFWLGARFGRPMASRLVGTGELQRLEEMSRRVGDWLIVVARPVPVLAEASILFAGMSRMPPHRFVLLTTLSNLGISAVYAGIGALSATLNSFLLAVAASILVPLLAMMIMRRD